MATDRNLVIQIRVTQGEKKQIVDAAKAHDLSLSNWVRRSVLAASKSGSIENFLATFKTDDTLPPMKLYVDLKATSDSDSVAQVVDDVVVFNTDH